MAVRCGEVAKLIDLVFKGVYCAPLLGAEARDEFPSGDRFTGYENGVDATRKSSNAPSHHPGRRAVGDAIDQRTKDLRKEETAVDEESLRPRQ